MNISRASVTKLKRIDISPDLIEMSRERIGQIPYDVDHQTSLQRSFEVHDIEARPARGENLTRVICYDSLHHFENEDAVMRHIAAMLNVGGVLFILEGERPPAWLRNRGRATRRHDSVWNA